MTIALASDHAGYEMKGQIGEYLHSKGYDTIDFGPETALQSADYPIYGERAAQAVAAGSCALGILICGTGVGMSLVANKVRGIRAAACSEPYSARLTRQHNDANILCIGARIIGIELAKMIVDEFTKSTFEGGRHQRRVDLIMQIEEKGHL